MPNWCEGIMKIKGNFDDVRKCVMNMFDIIPTSGLDQSEPKTEDYMEIIDDGNDGREFWMKIHKTCYVKETQRAFVEPQNIDFAMSDRFKTTVAVIEIKQAWDIEAGDFTAFSKKYNVDIKLHGFEHGMEFVRDVLIKKGEIVYNNDIQYEHYAWDCWFPNLGG